MNGSVKPGWKRLLSNTHRPRLTKDLDRPSPLHVHHGKEKTFKWPQLEGGLKAPLCVQVRKSAVKRAERRFLPRVTRLLHKQSNKEALFKAASSGMWSS